MFEIKPLSEEAVPAAIERAQHYRLLNEPMEAESICRDVLELDPENQRVLIILLLALTDQFDERLHENHGLAKEILERLTDDYCKLYYRGIIFERAAKSAFTRGGPGSGSVAYDEFRQAMECYEQAAAIRPKGNDDSILRWNTCARAINKYAELQPAPEQTTPLMLE